MHPPTESAAPADRARKAKRAPLDKHERVIERYTDDLGTREVIVRCCRHGARLVIDRDPLGRDRPRLLARLDPDEPHANARLLCERYLATPPEGRRCRAPLRADELPDPAPGRYARDERAWCLRTGGFVHEIRAMPGAMSIPELRWTRTDQWGHVTVLSLRAAIAWLESYEPFCRHTRSALAHHDGDSSVSSTVLRTELARVLRSPIVLNRALREAVLTRVRRGDATMSEIAIRCGRLKRDMKGNRSGETSWLARRIGLLPEGGHRAPTPWVHSDVLALIARDGLGLAPREVELG